VAAQRPYLGLRYRPSLALCLYILVRQPMITICMLGAGNGPSPRSRWERPVAAWWRSSTSWRAARG